ncbi:hypothetical protein [Henriciella litoralis]|uniref:hypothetical protein n=1 Tax=Henriciella litoralis TaxID=568102 RepID=UPI0009FC00DA|nr:hypothetical protein [Henriciella litoralis]
MGQYWKTTVQVASIAAFGLLTACGGSAGPENEAKTSADERPANTSTLADRGEAAKADTASGPINAFSFEATGAELSNPVPSPEELIPAGGCNGESQIGLSFHRGDMTESRWFAVGFTTKAVVAPGETGVFPLQALQWDNGVERPPNLPEDSPARVARRFMGADGVTLTLETHIATSRERRMAGTLQGHVKRFGTDEAADITAHFDVNQSCGVK